MTDVKRSPYTGRPVEEWLDREIVLHDADGDEIGNVVEINPDFIVCQANTGFLGLGEPRIYFIPRAQIGREDDNDWYINIDKDQIESMSWRQAPTSSAWATDWHDTNIRQKFGRGQTKIRRYEEDLQAEKHPREAGDVVVQKRVVEDTKTIDVPVRREEVHVERRAVSDTSAVGGDAFREQSMRVPVMEEQVEVRKVPRAVEEVEITKTPTTETRQVQDTVRREEVDVDDRTRA
jgi:uncharacterized protein (TIGR02271 family)